MEKVTLVAGLGYGDEGKGTIVDWLAREGRDRARASLVVRYNGGAQAAHNVVSGDRHHTFAQLGSATFSGVPTLLSRHVLVNPIALYAEARHLVSLGIADPLALVAVEAGALVTTPLHVAANRLREMARTGRHGSCGMGVGETMEDFLAVRGDALVVGDLEDPRRTRDKLLALRARKRASLEGLAIPDSPAAERERAVLEEDRTIATSLDAYASFARSAGGVRVVGPEYLASARGHVIFEGAQGVLLDQDFGFQPHTTWTDITFGNARELLASVSFRGELVRLGVLRAYATRHGAGPFVSEDAGLAALSAHDHNGWGEWQQGFRSGALDLVATRYALEVIGGVDRLAITNVDRLELLGAHVPVTVAYAGEAAPAFFEGTGARGTTGRIARIRVRRPFDLAHQEALTRALEAVRAINVPFPLGGYADAVATRLGVPLAVTSHGPRAEDKIARGEARAHLAPAMGPVPISLSAPSTSAL
jgi:adenylosuccinate synthase